MLTVGCVKLLQALFQRSPVSRVLSFPYACAGLGASGTGTFARELAKTLEQSGRQSTCRTSNLGYAKSVHWRCSLAHMPKACCQVARRSHLCSDRKRDADPASPYGWPPTSQKHCSPRAYRHRVLLSARTFLLVDLLDQPAWGRNFDVRGIMKPSTA